MIEILDVSGTFVFAIAGAFRALHHKLDLLGVMVLAVATGVGGGMTRDVLLGATPVAALQTELYLFVCILGGTAVLISAPHIARGWNAVRIADAVGLGVFAAIGAAKATYFGLGPIGVVMMGTLTATGGGIIRDVLVREVPAVLRHDFYATAALIGSGVLLFVQAIGFGEAVQLWSCIITTSGLRFYAMQKDVSLPRIEPLPDLEAGADVEQ